MPPSLLQRLLRSREIATAILLVLVIVAAGIKEPRFLKADSVESILLWMPLFAVIGLGQMMVIVCRGIDISVGSIVGVAAMVEGTLFRAHPTMSLALGTSISIGVGFALGSLNGVLVAFANVPPIIATLGTFSAYRGLVFIVCRGQQVDSNDIPDALTKWSSDGPIHVAGITIPWILIIALVVSGIAAWFLRMTRGGRDIFTFGSNPEAARLRGVPVKRTVYLVYAITGALCGLAGSLYLSKFGFVNPATAGQGLELVVIAAVVIGGTNISGGSGSVLGVLLGCALLGAINVALTFVGIDEAWQQLVYGIVILLAILIDTWVRRSQDRSREGSRVH